MNSELLDSFNDSDVIITLKKNQEGDILASPRMRVYCKDNKKFKQISFLEEFKLVVKSDVYPVFVQAKLNKVSDSMLEYSELLKKSGISLDLCTCTTTENGLGVDSNCPIHGKID